MSAASPAQEAPPSLREFAYHVHQERYGAAWMFGLVFGAFLLAAALLPPSYRATATLAVLPAPEYTVRGTVGSHDTNASALALDQIMMAETAILGSDDLHGATLRKLGPASVYPAIFAPDQRNFAMRALHGAIQFILSPWRVTPADPAAARDQRGLQRFASDFLVLPTKDANIISVSLDHGDARIAAAAVNTLLGLYAVRRTRLYDDPQLGIVRQAVAVAAAKAAAADQAVADYKRSTSLSDSAQQRALLLHRLDAAQIGIAEAGSARAEQQARIESLSQALRAEPANVAIFREQDPDTRLQAVNGSLQDLRAKLAAARLKFLDTSRVVTTLNAQIAAVKAESARLGHDPASSVVRQGRNPNLDSLRMDRARAGAELAAAEARLAAGRDQARDAQAALARLDEAETGFLALAREAQAADDAFTNASRILADRHLSESEDMLRLANVRVIQPATVPQVPRPLPALLIGAGFMLGLLAAFLRVVGRYVLHPVFLTDEGLELATGLPVLAVFPRVPESQKEALLF